MLLVTILGSSACRTIYLVKSESRTTRCRLTAAVGVVGAAKSSSAWLPHRGHLGLDLSSMTYMRQRVHAPITSAVIIDDDDVACSSSSEDSVAAAGRFLLSASWLATTMLSSQFNQTKNKRNFSLEDHFNTTASIKLRFLRKQFFLPILTPISLDDQYIYQTRGSYSSWIVCKITLYNSGIPEEAEGWFKEIFWE